MIEAIVQERNAFGPSEIWRILLAACRVKESLNKRVIENFIKAGALDWLGGTRKQFMSIYIQIMDHVSQEKKYSMSRTDEPCLTMARGPERGI